MIIIIIIIIVESNYRLKIWTSKKRKGGVSSSNPVEDNGCWRMAEFGANVGEWLLELLCASANGGQTWHLPCSS